MVNRSTAFAKGGCGCLVVFLGVGLLMALGGGHITINCGGAAILFLIGGVIGLILLAVYKKGVRAGQEQAPEEPPDEPPSPPAGWWCRACGCSNPHSALREVAIQQFPRG